MKPPPPDGLQDMTPLASLEVKYTSENTSELGDSEHKTIFAFQEESKIDALNEDQIERLATLSLRVLCLLRWSGTR